MRLATAISREFENAPIGTTAGLIGVISTLLGGSATVTFNGLAGSPIPMKFGIALSMSILAASALSFGTAIVFRPNRLSTYVLHIFFCVIFATFCNTFFWFFFPEKSVSGGPGDLIMILTAMSLTTLYQLMFLERMNSDDWSVEHITGRELTFSLVALACGTLIIPARIYIPIF